MKLKFPYLKGGARNHVILSGSIVLGGSGAIASVTGFLPTTATAGTQGVIKTATKTGRYSLVLDRKYKTVRFLGAPGLVGDTNAAIGNTNANIAFYRNRTSNSFDIQLALASSGADTDGASGTEIHWAIEVREM